MQLSPYNDIHWFVIRPTKDGYVTKKDQLSLGESKHFARTKLRCYCVPFNTSHKASILSRIRKAKLSKPMIITEITDAQFGLRNRFKETIEGTGFYATKKQLAESFINQ